MFFAYNKIGSDNMLIKTPDYYKNFTCLAGKCKYSCCKSGWEIVIDKNSLDFYKTIDGSFGNKLKQTIKVDKKENCFKSVNNICPFFNSNGLCDIQCEFGEEHLCKTCRTYPRFTYEYGPLRETGISLSCPEAARLIVEKTSPVLFKEKKTNETVSTYNDISAELFMFLTKARDTAIKICQSRSLPVNIRAAILLKFAKKVQKDIKSKNYNKTNIIEKYSSDEFLKLKSSRLKLNLAKTENHKLYFKTFISLEHLPSLNNYINKIESNLNRLTSENFYEKNSYRYEQILVYFIYKYFLEALFDYDVISKVKLAVVSIVIIDKLQQIFKDDFIDIVCMYSRDIEHSDKNLNNLKKSFKHKDEFKFKNIIL